MRFTGKGKPGKDVEANIGDIYVDETCGVTYKCTFAFQSSSGSEVVREWTKLKQKYAAKPKDVVIPKDSVISNDISKGVENQSEEIKPEKVDYTSYHKKNQKGNHV